MFAFFSDARNLEALTPPWLNFRILTPQAAVKEGLLIRYQLSWHGFPLRWTTKITAWQPPHMFEDVQLSGPYALWQHTHRFESVDGGTRITDEVRYRLPFGLIGRFAH